MFMAISYHLCSTWLTEKIVIENIYSSLSCIFHRLRNKICGKCFLTHLWGLGLSVCFLRQVLRVVCQLLFCCPPLLTYIFEPQFPPNPSFELMTYTLLVRYSLLRLWAYNYCFIVLYFSYIMYNVRMYWFETY